MLVWILLVIFAALSAGEFQDVPFEYCDTVQFCPFYLHETGRADLFMSRPDEKMLIHLNKLSHCTHNIRSFQLDTCARFEKINNVMSCVVKKSAKKLIARGTAVSPYDVDRASAKLSLKWNVFPIPGMTVDACSVSISPPCPLKAGQEYVVKYDASRFMGLLPTGRYSLKLVVKDQNGNLIGCAQGQGRLES